MGTPTQEKIIIATGITRQKIMIRDYNLIGTDNTLSYYDATKLVNGQTTEIQIKTTSTDSIIGTHIINNAGVRPEGIGILKNLHWLYGVWNAEEDERKRTYYISPQTMNIVLNETEKQMNLETKFGSAILDKLTNNNWKDIVYEILGRKTIYSIEDILFLTRLTAFSTKSLTPSLAKKVIENLQDSSSGFSVEATIRVLSVKAEGMFDKAVRERTVNMPQWFYDDYFETPGFQLVQSVEHLDELIARHLQESPILPPSIRGLARFCPQLDLLK